jgi:hypothetical protein
VGKLTVEEDIGNGSIPGRVPSMRETILGTLKGCGHR